MASGWPQHNTSSESRTAAPDDQNGLVPIETPTEELARLLERAETQNLRALRFGDLRRLARLYRGETARLSRLRDRGGDMDRIGYLNSLCVRAHALLYSAKPKVDKTPFFARVAQTLSSGLAGTARLQLIAWSIMGLGALIGYFLVALDPAALYALMPSSLGYDIGQIDLLYRSAEAREIFFAREATPVSENALFGSYLFANNTRVGILAFATGMLFGIPTLVLQLFNGIMLGAIGAIFLRSESAIPFLAWILPHGVPELTAITLCAAAGLTLGSAIAVPGRRTRGEALRLATPKAVALFVISVPLFFAAAAIESFIRESALGLPTRFAIAAASAITLLAIAWLLTKTQRTTNPQSDWIDLLLAESTASVSVPMPPASPTPTPASASHTTP